MWITGSDMYNQQQCITFTIMKQWCIILAETHISHGDGEMYTIYPQEINWL